MNPRKGVFVVPLVIFAIIAGIVMYRYRYAVPALRPGVNGAADTFDVDAQLDAAKSSVIVTARNYLSTTVTFDLDVLTWNDAPMKEPLPKALQIPPFGERRLRFTPIDPRVGRYGDALLTTFRYTAGNEGGSGSLGGGGGGQPAIRYTPTTAAEFELSASDWPHPIEVRNVRLVSRKKVLREVAGPTTLTQNSALSIKSPLSLAKKPFSVQFEYRVTPWSRWIAESYDMDEP